jgi:hypothetical protein
MGLSRGNQDRIYKSYWEVIEKNAKDETLNKTRVSEFIRDYLTLKNKEIPKKEEGFTQDIIKILFQLLRLLFIFI